jgi:hypothetical protein
MRAKLKVWLLAAGAAFLATNTSHAQATDLGAMIAADRAASVFLSVCKESADRDFADAEAAMAQVGVTKKNAETGTVYSETEDLSFRIMDGPGMGKSCSMVFITGDSPEQVADALPKVAPFQDSPFGPMTVLEGSIAVIYVAQNPGSGDGGPFAHSLRMLSVRE